MTTAVDILIKYQRTYNKKYTQEEADDLVQKALMRDRAETLQLYFEMLPEVADGGMFGMLFCRAKKGVGEIDVPDFKRSVPFTGE